MALLTHCTDRETESQAGSERWSRSQGEPAFNPGPEMQDPGSKYPTEGLGRAPLGDGCSCLSLSFILPAAA